MTLTFDDDAKNGIIKVDNTTIATETLTGGKNEFVNKEYTIPADLLEGKTQVRVKFQAKSGNTAGGVYYVRLLMSESEATAVSSPNFDMPRADGHIYTLDGRRTDDDFSRLSRGIYIVGGKKVAK